MNKKQSKVLKKGGNISKEVMKKIVKKVRGKVGTKVVTKKGDTKDKREVKLPDHHFKMVKVKRGLAGLGLFAGEDIKKNELVIEYIGEILNKEEAENKTSGQYLFEVNRNKTIDGSVRWNIARYANHSCAGNSESEIKKGRVFVKATKNIKEGDEIVYDYGEEFVNEFITPNGCRCSAKRHLYGAKGYEAETKSGTASEVNAEAQNEMSGISVVH